MSKRDGRGGTGSGLAAAAGALDGAIARYEELVGQAAKIPLDSQKNLERAAEAVQRAATHQEQVGDLLRALAEAIASSSERQTNAAETLQRRAQEIQARSAETSALLARFEELGRDARDVNAQLVAAMPDKQSAPAGPERVKQTIGDLEAVEERMGSIVERAGELERAAEAAGFGDLARQAESLRQQTLAARNKVHLVRASFG
ncbi:MAG TPA: hypothetical protein VHB21_27445 [Minicystis sp.]|nr:hypothetical protein [Minicystis sp.]